MEDNNKYAHNWTESIFLVIGESAKYSSLMLGIYSICKDERDFLLTSVGGLGYLFGIGMEHLAGDEQKKRNFSKLEESLKK